MPTIEERVVELESALLRTQAKAPATFFVVNFALSGMLKSHPEVGRELVELTKGTLTPGNLPPPFADKPEFARKFVEHITRVIAQIVDPYASPP